MATPEPQICSYELVLDDETTESVWDQTYPTQQEAVSFLKSQVEFQSLSSVEDGQLSFYVGGKRISDKPFVWKALMARLQPEAIIEVRLLSGTIAPKAIKTEESKQNVIAQPPKGQSGVHEGPTATVEESIMVSPDKPLSKLFAYFAATDQMQRDVDTLAFCRDGQILEPELTCAEAKLASGSRIDVIDKAASSDDDAVARPSTGPGTRLDGQASPGGGAQEVDANGAQHPSRPLSPSKEATVSKNNPLSTADEQAPTALPNANSLSAAPTVMPALVPTQQRVAHVSISAGPTVDAAGPTGPVQPSASAREDNGAVEDDARASEGVATGNSSVLAEPAAESDGNALAESSTGPGTRSEGYPISTRDVQEVALDVPRLLSSSPPPAATFEDPTTNLLLAFPQSALRRSPSQSGGTTAATTDATLVQRASRPDARPSNAARSKKRGGEDLDMSDGVGGGSSSGCGREPIQKKAKVVKEKKPRKRKAKTAWILVLFDYLSSPGVDYEPFVELDMPLSKLFAIFATHVSFECDIQRRAWDLVFSADGRALDGDLTCAQAGLVDGARIEVTDKDDSSDQDALGAQQPAELSFHSQRRVSPEQAVRAVDHEPCDSPSPSPTPASQTPDQSIPLANLDSDDGISHESTADDVRSREQLFAPTVTAAEPSRAPLATQPSAVPTRCTPSPATTKTLSESPERERDREPDPVLSPPIPDTHSEGSGDDSESYSDDEEDYYDDEGFRDIGLYCICQTEYEEERAMVACDRCEDWFHLDCFDLSEDSVDSAGYFICPDCSEDGTGNWCQT